jgi:hypothetical protein
VNSNHNQVRTLIETLRHNDRSDTRRAVLQIFEAADTEGNHTPISAPLRRRTDVFMRQCQ